LISALTGQQVLRIAAIGVDAGELAVGGVHVVATAARQAVAAGDEGMADHGVADLDSLDAGSDLLDPAGVLVAHDVGERHLDLAAPDALDDVQVGAADAGAANAHDHVGRCGDARVGHVLIVDELVAGERLIIGFEHCCFHTFVPRRGAALSAGGYGGISASSVPLQKTADCLGFPA